MHFKCTIHFAIDEYMCDEDSDTIIEGGVSTLDTQGIVVSIQTDNHLCRCGICCCSTS